MILRWLPGIAIVVGLLTRIGVGATWLIQPCLMLIMFAAFVEARVFRGWHPVRGFLARVVLLQFVAGCLLFLLLHPLSPELAIAALVLALTPTAVSGAAVASASGADVRLVTSAIAATNLLACISFPAVAMYVNGGESPLNSFARPAMLVAVTVVLPFLAAAVTVSRLANTGRVVERRFWRIGVRCLWATILWVSASKVGDWYFTEYSGRYLDGILWLVVGAGAFAVFALLSRFGARAQRLERLICSSHKNAGLALLLTLESFPIVVAAVVLSYSLTQNIVFSILPGRRRRRRG